MNEWFMWWRNAEPYERQTPLKPKKAEFGLRKIALEKQKMRGKIKGPFKTLNMMANECGHKFF